MAKLLERIQTKDLDLRFLCAIIIYIGTDSMTEVVGTLPYGVRTVAKHTCNSDV